MDEQGRSYFLGGHAGVAGWVGGSSLSLLLAVDRFQRRIGVQGGVCEIGVHHGRFFIPLALLRRPEERGLAIDVFDLQEFNVDGSGLGDLHAFQANLDRWTGTERLDILKQDSLTVSRADIVSRLHGPVRLFSVDGSHTAGHTLNDIRLAKEALSPGGVIFVDDYLNPDWPGVTEAIATLLSDANSGLACPCYGGNKLLLVRAEDQASTLDFVRGALVPIAFHAKPVDFWGKPSFHITLDDPTQVFDIVGRTSPASLSLQDPRADLGGGWGSPEPTGRWTLGCSTAVQLPMRPGGRPSLLAVQASTFLAGPRVEQSLSVTLGTTELTGQPVTEADRWFSFPIPHGTPSGSIERIRLNVTDCRSPFEVGLNSDTRPLGVKVRRIVLLDEL